MRSFFQKFAQQISNATGSPYAFLSALALVIGWALAGKPLNYSDVWMLWINTGTTIATFLQVFIIQSAQNRDSKIARIERQSILRAISDAPNTLLALDKDSDDRLDELQQELSEARHKAEEEG